MDYESKKRVVIRGYQGCKRRFPPDYFLERICMAIHAYECTCKKVRNTI